MRFLAQRVNNKAIGLGGAFKAADGAKNRHGHPAIGGINVKGVFLSAAADDFDGNHARRGSPQK